MTRTLFRFFLLAFFLNFSYYDLQAQTPEDVTIVAIYDPLTTADYWKKNNDKTWQKTNDEFKEVQWISVKYGGQDYYVMTYYRPSFLNNVAFYTDDIYYKILSQKQFDELHKKVAKQSGSLNLIKISWQGSIRDPKKFATKKDFFSALITDLKKNFKVSPLSNIYLQVISENKDGKSSVQFFPETEAYNNIKFCYWESSFDDYTKSITNSLPATSLNELVQKGNTPVIQENGIGKKRVNTTPSIQFNKKFPLISKAVSWHNTDGKWRSLELNFHNTRWATFNYMGESFYVYIYGSQHSYYKYPALKIGLVMYDTIDYLIFNEKQFGELKANISAQKGTPLVMSTTFNGYIDVENSKKDIGNIYDEDLLRDIEETLNGSSKSHIAFAVSTQIIDGKSNVRFTSPELENNYLIKLFESSYLEQPLADMKASLGM